MYLKPSEIVLDTLYQGDVMRGVPFLIFDKIVYLKKNSESSFGIVEKNDHNCDNKGESFIAVKSRLNSVIIVSQTCDIQKMETVMVAPIYSIKSFEDNGVLKDGKSGLIKKRKTFHWFYLPEFEGLIEDSFADFTSMHYIHKSILLERMSNKILTLSDWGRHHLDFSLGNFFCRPIEDKYSK